MSKQPKILKVCNRIPESSINRITLCLGVSQHFNEWPETNQAFQFQNNYISKHIREMSNLSLMKIYIKPEKTKTGWRMGKLFLLVPLWTYPLV